MFTISVETRFWASHRLKSSNSSKEKVHNHNWSVTAEISSSKLNSLGFVMDFDRVKTQLCNIVAEFDNKSLDSTDYFQQNNPSAENVAGYVYGKLKTKLPKAVRLQSVRVIEEPGCSAIFTGDKSAK